MWGIPTIRVFEALACGIPLISAPWNDTERLFRKGDFLFVRDQHEMEQAIEFLLDNPAAAQAQALRGWETILARHTCRHRAEQLLDICEEVLDTYLRDNQLACRMHADGSYERKQPGEGEQPVNVQDRLMRLR